MDYVVPFPNFHQGNRQPLAQLVAGWIDNLDDHYVRPTITSEISYLLENYEDHVHWFIVRVEQRDILGWFMDFLHWNPSCWDKLRKWALSDPEKIKQRIELIDRHRALVDRVLTYPSFAVHSVNSEIRRLSFIVVRYSHQAAFCGPNPILSASADNHHGEKMDQQSPSPLIQMNLVPPLGEF